MALDILAVWSSTRILQQALYERIQSGRNSEACLAQINLAHRAAPPGSITSIQALAAIAVLSDNDRESKVNELTHLLPSSTTTLLPTSFASINTCSPVHSNTLVAINCVKALVRVSSERNADSLYNALELLGETFYNFKSMDLLAFAAALSWSQCFLET